MNRAKPEIIGQYFFVLPYNPHEIFENKIMNFLITKNKENGKFR